MLGIFWIVSSSLEQTGLFTNIDKFISNLMVPTNAILIAIFVGWVLDKKMLRKELPKTSQLYFDIFIFLCKWVCPVVVTTILIRGI